MQMGMVKQILAPGVKDGKESDDGAEMLGIGVNGLERHGRGPEENAVNGSLVLEGDVGNLFRDGKDHVKILGLQNLGLPILDPLGARKGLAFGTVAVRAGVVGNTLMTAMIADLDVTAKSGGTAAFNGGHDASLRPR